MSKIRPSTQIAQDGAGTGQGLVWNGSAWVPTALLSDPTTTKGDLLVRSASAIARLPIGTDTQVLTADSTQTLGVRWAAAAGGGTAVKVATARKTSGDTTLAYSTAWAAVDTTLDLTLAGVTAGDFVEVNLRVMAATNPSVNVLEVDFDMVSLVSGTAQNFWANGDTTGSGSYTAPTPGWCFLKAAGASWPVPIHAAKGSAIRAVASGDLSAGSLTLRLMYRIYNAGTSATQAILSRAFSPLEVWAKNYGH